MIDKPITLPLVIASSRELEQDTAALILAPADNNHGRILMYGNPPNVDAPETIRFPSLLGHHEFNPGPYVAKPVTRDSLPLTNHE